MVVCGIFVSCIVNWANRSLEEISEAISDEGVEA